METIQKNLEELSLNQGLTLELNSEVSHLKHSVSHDILSLITIKAPLYETESSRSPIDLIAVLDHSGSMDGEKIKMVQNSMNFAVSQLKSDDRLSIILFESEVTTLFPLKEMDSKNKQDAIDSINSIKAKNLTNLSGGLEEGFKQLILDQEYSSERSKNSVCSILLFTDGLANKGLTKTEEIKEILLKKREELKKPCTVFCFGYGSDHSTEMLRGISDAGDGMYYYVEDEEKIPSAFGDCIGGLLSVTAQNLKLKLESHNGVQIKKILGAPISGKHSLNKASDTEVNGPLYEREMGDIYSEEERNIVCLLHVPSLEQGSEESQLMLTCEVTGFDIIKKDAINEKMSVSIFRGEETKMDKEKSVRIDVHRNRLITVQALTNSKLLADKGHLDQGRNILLQAIHELKNSPSSDKPLTVSLIDDLEESLRDMRDREEYSSKGSKKMAMYSRSHACERAIHSKANYMNKAKMMEKEKYVRNVIPMGEEELQLTKTLPVAPSRLGNEKTFIVGNKYRKLEDSEKTSSSSSPTGLCEHEWTMFVNLPESSNEKISDIVEKVIFNLHPTFEPNFEIVESEPFSITKKGWGTFAVKCDIHFKSQLNRSPEIIYHQLVFETNGSSITHKVLF